MTSLLQFAPWCNQPAYNSFKYLETILDGINYVIAGGSARKLYVREAMKMSDIDVWFHDEESLLEAKQRLDAVMHPNTVFNPKNEFSKPFVNSFLQVAHTEYGYTFVNNNLTNSNLPYTANVQLLRKQTVGDGIEGVIGIFDYTICQFAYTKGLIYATPAAIADHKAGILRRNPICTAPVCYERAMKYMGKGYTPTIELFDLLFLNNRESMKHGSVSLENLFYEDNFKRV